MASVPLSGTNIRLLADVPFSNDYKHTRYFKNESSQNQYFWAKPVVHKVTQANFQRFNDKTFIKIDKNVDELYGTNYIAFQNNFYKDKWFYAFVTKLEYKQKNTTYVHFELDVFQTWWFSVDLKPSFVVREHCKLWNSDGTPVINTVDEGLDYGSDYDTVNYNLIKPNDGMKWFVIIAKGLLHDEVNYARVGGIRPTPVGSIQPLCYYLIPFYDEGSNNPTAVQFGSNGTINQLSPVNKIFLDIFRDVSVVNNVVSIFSTESIGINVTVTNFSSNIKQITIPDTGYLKRVQIGGSDEENPDDPYENRPDSTVLFVNEVPKFQADYINVTNDKYKNFQPVKESKLLMYPYAITTMEDFKGNRVDLKTEYIQGKSLDVTIRGSMGTSNKVSYSVDRYNTSGLSEGFDRKLGIEYGIINDNPNEAPVLTEYLASFIQGNRNSIETQRRSIAFNTGAEVSKSAINGIQGALLMNPFTVAKEGINIVQGAGNGVLQMEAIGSKLKDASNVPPSISKMGSNTSFDYGNRYNGTYLLQKQIKKEYRDKLSSFWGAYGYKVAEIKKPNLDTRKYWNYIQTKDCVIRGSINNEDLQGIKDVFDGGITLWHTDDIGNYTLNNSVI